MGRDSYKKKRARLASSTNALEAKRRRKLEREVSSDEHVSYSTVDSVHFPQTDCSESSGLPLSLPISDTTTMACDQIPIEVHTPDFEGRRVISCVSLLNFAHKLSRHGWDCKGTVNFAFETTHHGGLCREQTFKCECGWVVQLASDTGKESLPVNEGLTWGMQAAAVGYDSMSVIATAIDLPFISRGCFTKHLQKARGSFITAMNEDIRKAGEEERRLAIEAGDFIIIEGTQYVKIVVIIDGGWDKRTYGHGYDANSGVGVIIGARTGKVLYSGTRTKICFTCSLANNKGQEPAVHVCSKNWTKSSTAMEADILAEGFRQSIPMHGLIYASFVGDGDSSTYSAVQNTYPGIKVEKIECFNHALKNFHKKLHDIANDCVRGKNALRIPKEDRQLPGIEDAFKRINLDIRSAILHHHQLKDEPHQDQKLSDDLHNVVRHVFGEHSQCREHYCDPLGPRRTEENVFHLMSSRVFFTPLVAAISRLASMASSLIQKRNTNLAESFMSVANKYTEGKRKSLGGGILYSLRMTCAVLSYNNNRYWLVEAYRTVYGREPLSGWLRAEQREVKVRARAPKKRAHKVRTFGFLKSGRSKGDQHYGTDAMQPPLSIDVRQYEIKKAMQNLSVDTAGQKHIEESTRNQSECDAWFEQRRPRITASLAGRIFKLKSTSDNTSILNAIFQPHRGRGTIAMRYGMDSEPLAVAKYEAINGLELGAVQKVGFLVSLEDGVLGASPDGLIGDQGLLECKCPYVIRNATPLQWPRMSTNSALSLESGTLRLKTNHHHYYQVIMELFVSGREWIDYFVWTPKGHFVQRIVRNDESLAVWLGLREKLIKFWKEDVAPELVDSRERRKSNEYLCSDDRLIGRTRLRDRKEKKK